jgi:23S rRNA (cytosine1962-C5)-methyltransferase
MSAIRKIMLPLVAEKKSFLNLYCYTGAFSLFALKNKFEKVVSVDLSGKYLDWLDENLALNDDINPDFHSRINAPCEKALAKLIDQKSEVFDVIVCDPPSASSDGQKFTNALKSYETLLPQMIKLLNPSGGKLFVFLNTHAISWNKFEEKCQSIISQSEFKNQMIVGKRLKLSEDCTPLKGFHEGDYLKGLVIEYKNQNKAKTQ